MRKHLLLGIPRLENEFYSTSAKFPFCQFFVAILLYILQLHSCLGKPDDLKNRYVDNADFFTVSNVSDFYERDEIYNFLLNEYPGWLENSKVKTMISSNYTRGSQKETQKKKLFGLF